MSTPRHALDESGSYRSFCSCYPIRQSAVGRASPHGCFFAANPVFNPGSYPTRNCYPITALALSTTPHTTTIALVP